MTDRKMETILLNTHNLARAVFYFKLLLHVRTVTCRDSCTAINTQEGALMLWVILIAVALTELSSLTH